MWEFSPQTKLGYCQTVFIVNRTSYGNDYIPLCIRFIGNKVILILQRLVRKYVFFERCKVNNIGTKMKKRNLNLIATKVEASSSRARLTYDFGFGDETKGFARTVSGGRLIEKIALRKIFYNLYS